MVLTDPTGMSKPPLFLGAEVNLLRLASALDRANNLFEPASLVSKFCIKHIWHYLFYFSLGISPSPEIKQLQVTHRYLSWLSSSIVILKFSTRTSTECLDVILIFLAFPASP